jgi:hypothetical protein
MSIIVSGSDVYVAGIETSTSNHSVAKVWKNGVATALSDGTRNASASSVVVLGSDVYVGGYDYVTNYPAAKYWKNGVGILMTNGASSAQGQALAVIQR